MVSILYREVGQHESDPWMVCSPSEYSKESSPFTTATVIREIPRVWEGYEWKGCWEWGVGGDRVQLEQLLRQSRNTVIDSSWFTISIQLVGRVWILPTQWLYMCAHIWGCVHVCWWMCTHLCTCMWRLYGDVRCSPRLLSPEPETHPFSYADCPVSSRIPPTSTFSALGLESHTVAAIWLLMAAKDPNLDVHAQYTQLQLLRLWSDGYAGVFDFVVPRCLCA